MLPIILCLFCITTNAITLHHETPYRGPMIFDRHTDQDILKMADDAMIVVKDIVSERCDWHGNLQYTITLMSEQFFLALVTSSYTLKDDVLYPRMLIDTEQNDMEIKLNKDIDWIDGKDLVSVLLHETIHAMGIMSSFYGKDKYKRCIDGECYFTRFDTLIEYDGRRLIDSLDDEWIGKEMYIDDIQIYNPHFFQPRSSLSHLHDGDSIMSHLMMKKNRKIDNNVLRILNKIGWNCTLEQNILLTPDDTDPMIWITIGIGIFLIIVCILCCVFIKLRKTEIEFTPKTF